MDDFQSQTVPQPQQFLEICGIITNGLRKPTLVSLCQSAVTPGTDIDPDGLLENVEEVLAAKLDTGDGDYLMNPGLLSSTVNLSILPLINVLDIYN